jgi:hypothetical protein
VVSLPPHNLLAAAGRPGQQQQPNNRHHLLQQPHSKLNGGGGGGGIRVHAGGTFPYSSSSPKAPLLAVELLISHHTVHYNYFCVCYIF